MQSLSVVLFEMIRYASIINIVTRNLISFYSDSVVLKLGVRPYLIHFASIRTTHPIFRKMGDTQSQSGLPGFPEPENNLVSDRSGKIHLSDEEWKKRLTPAEYHVARKRGTEQPHSGHLLHQKGKGMYVCTCCGTELFSSSAKYESGCGWPAFSQVLKDKEASEKLAVDTHTDTSYGMVRTEVKCGKCDAHLGHVFDDGPQPGGLRYCVNSVSMKFRPDVPNMKEKEDN